jgi:hypothetical protein
MTDFRALCAEMLDGWTKGNDIFGPMQRARVALAQPKPQGPSEQEVSEWINSLPLWHGATRDELTGIVLRALARWGRTATTEDQQ